MIEILIFAMSLFLLSSIIGAIYYFLNKKSPECPTDTIYNTDDGKCDQSFVKCRYIKVTSATNGLALNFAELEAYDTNGVNVALNKTATQSSIGWDNTEKVGPQNAVDGSKDTVIHTKDENTDEFHWWQVDLGSEMNITKIVLQRRENCCQGRENGAKIQLLANDGTTVNHEFEAGVLEQTLGEFPLPEEYEVPISKVDTIESFTNVNNYSIF